MKVRTYVSMSIRFLSVYLFLMMCFSLCQVANSLSAEITEDIRFSKDDLSFTKIRDFDLISFRDCDFMDVVGDPMLPVKNTYLVIPPDAKVEDVKVEATDEEELGETYNIFPVQEPTPLQEEREPFVYMREVTFKEPNPITYSSSELYPEKIVEITGEGLLNDYKIVSLRVYPVRYVPVEKKIIFYSRISFTLTYSQLAVARAPAAMRDQRVQRRLSRMVERLVSNPEDVEKWTMPPARLAPTERLISEGIVEYVIITSEGLATEFQRLADWKTKKGIPTEVKTISWISSQYPGADTQEMIRNFIKDFYGSRGTIWVLLGGDTGVVPHRTAYAMTSGGGHHPDEDKIPADLYYSDLDGDWNADGDSVYGEVSDSVDLYPDVFVGRAPVKNAAEAQTFVSKVLEYEKGPADGYLINALMLAEHLDNYTDGGTAKDMIVSSYFPSSFNVTKLYESDGNLNRASAISHINQGYNLINHVAHCWYSSMGMGPDVVSRPDMDALANGKKYSIIYSIGCWPNAIDLDCISEHFMLSANGGGVSFVGNTRYGWYYRGAPGYGTSDKYDQEFFKSLFHGGIYNIGETLADSKVAYISSSQSANTYRWVQYCLSLLGDPEMPIWTVVPQTLIVGTIQPTQTEIDVTVESDGNPVEDARICLQKKEDGIYVVGYSDSNGQKVFNLGTPHTEGELSITVTKHNFRPYEGMIPPVVIPPPPPEISSSTHPNESKTYRDRDPSFSWTMPETAPKIAGYSCVLDQSASTTPDETVNTTKMSKSYTDLKNGVWYFHVRAKSDKGAWGDADHYKVTIKRRPWWQLGCLF